MDEKYSVIRSLQFIKNKVGESLVINPNGDVVAKVEAGEQLLVCEIDLNESVKRQREVPYLSTRRKEWYK